MPRRIPKKETALQAKRRRDATASGANRRKHGKYPKRRPKPISKGTRKKVATRKSTSKKYPMRSR